MYERMYGSSVAKCTGNKWLDQEVSNPAHMHIDEENLAYQFSVKPATSLTYIFQVKYSESYSFFASDRKRLFMVSYKNTSYLTFNINKAHDQITLSNVNEIIPDLDLNFLVNR